MDYVNDVSIMGNPGRLTINNLKNNGNLCFGNAESIIIMSKVHEAPMFV